MARAGFVLGPLCILAMAGAVSAQAPAKVDFATDVQPILRANCIECHGPDKQRAGMRIDRKSSVMKAFSRRVVPGSSTNSFLYHRIVGEYGAPMPPDGSLKKDQIAIIKAGSTREPNGPTRWQMRWTGPLRMPRQWRWWSRSALTIWLHL